MAYFIKVDESNQAIGHPFFQENLEQVYPNHDWSNGPMTGYLEFVHVAPELGVYQKFDETVGADISLAFNHNGLEYKLIDGKIKQFWHVLDLTDAEKKTKQDQVKANWAALDPAGPASWTFDEATCSYKAPVAYPSDGKNYKWDESTTSWKEVTEQYQDHA